MRFARLRPRGVLWAMPDFRHLWAAQTASVFGDQISILALPLAAVLVLDASAAEMGLLAAAGWMPHLLFSLVAGLVVDSAERRARIVIAADVARAAALLTIPAAYWLDALTMAHLLVVAFAVGTLTVLFDVAMSGYFPRVVPREHIVEAQGSFGATRSLSYIAGPSLAGVLVQVLSAPVAVLADALSFLLSGAFIARVRAVEPPREPREHESIRARLAAGFRYTLGHPILRAATGATSVINFFNLGFSAIVVLYLSRELELEAGLIGLVFGAGAIGALLGSLVAAPIGRRIGVGPAIVVGSLLFPLPLLAFPLADGPTPLVVVVLIAGEFLAGVGVMLFDVNQNSLIVLVTPDRMRPLQMSTMRFFVYGVRPLGALAGGFLGAALGLREALFVTAALTTLGVLFLLFSPVRTLRELPADPG